MANKLYHTVSKLRSLSPKVKSNYKKVITDFAERSNMIYFGFVSQLNDEHKLVRGLTVSTRHQDHHYCVGTYQGYDVVFVERSDTLLTSGHKHTWHIMAFDLASAHDLPHIFIGSPHHGNGFHSLMKAKYSTMLPVQLGMTAEYPAQFTDYFSIITNPSQAVLAEQLINPEMAGMIGNHFKGLVVEIIDNSLFVYSERTNLTATLLDTMIANGVWLARQLDEKSQRI